MDHANPRLEGRAQPIRGHLRKPVAGELGTVMIDQRTNDRKSRAVETVENITAVFPPFPQPLMLLTNLQPTRTTEDRLHKMLDAPINPVVGVCFFILFLDVVLFILLPFMRY